MSPTVSFSFLNRVNSLCKSTIFRNVNMPHCCMCMQVLRLRWCCWRRTRADYPADSGHSGCAPRGSQRYSESNWAHREEMSQDKEHTEQMTKAEKNHLDAAFNFISFGVKMTILAVFPFALKTIFNQEFKDSAADVDLMITLRVSLKYTKCFMKYFVNRQSVCDKIFTHLVAHVCRR